ncbi:MAG: aminomethyl-transferring glycine dehydrogenase subunit GcvPA [Tissierellia bacterium]|nr:aminomethyl-transferring glycine dehydrogenase subunit GcvPA [Tissierellia bacterium]
MYPYIPITEAEEQEMLKAIGLKSTEELFDYIPEELRLKKDLNLPLAKSEMEVMDYLRKLSCMNTSVNDATCFLGAGAYDHYIPSVVDHLLSRSEFYTSYTPYQPEISQGTLQNIFEFQTLIARLTGMDFANASLYDGGTAVAEAAILSVNTSGKNKILISKSARPDSRKVLETYAHFLKIDVEEVEIKDGLTDLDDLKSKMSDDVAGVILQSPNFFGLIEDVKTATEIAHTGKKTTMVLSTDPFTLGVLKKPSAYDVDVVIGEAQGLGIPLQFGGPYLGIIAAKKSYMRKVPGRLVGETIDRNGKRSFVLTLAAREQHIRRDKATSNICSNQGLNTLAANIYMSLMGKKGMKEVATQAAEKAHYAYDVLTKSGKFKPLFPDKPFFMEFALTSDIAPAKINEALLKEDIIGGYDLGKDYPEYKNAIMFAVTEKRTKEEIDKLSSVLEGI